VPGIGPKTVSRLERMGIRTLAELGVRDEDELEQAFGPRTGAWLRRRARLEDETPVVVEHETKSQSTEITFDVDVADREAQDASIVSLAEELCRRLRARDLRGRTIGIKVRLDDWTNVTRSQTLGKSTNDPEQVTAVALDLLHAYSPPRPVRLLGVRVAQFGEGEPAGEGDPEGPQMRLSLPG
jgi:DNA polymerase-4